MKPIVLSILAMICYALANVLVEQKFSRLNSLSIMLCYSPVIFLFAFVGLAILAVLCVAHGNTLHGESLPP